ncbi:MAG: VOC family protein [Bryobacteraceae bacterium]|nr:VOC family protein [Bryobacteraceae bacterium]
MSHPIPEGFHTVTPYISLENTAEAIEFYKRAFGAEETHRVNDGARVRHAQIRIGDSMLMLHDENPDWPKYKSAKTYGGSAVNLFLYVDDADAWVARAVAAGAQSVMPVADQEYGRAGGVEDPFGLTWWIVRP